MSAMVDELKERNSRLQKNSDSNSTENLGTATKSASIEVLSREENNSTTAATKAMNIENISKKPPDVMTTPVIYGKQKDIIER